MFTSGRGVAQEEILNVEFEDDSDLDVFFAPAGLAAVDLCGKDIPNGSVAIDGGELLLTNDEFLGLDMFSLDPDEVGDLFPDDTRDYKLRVLVNTETVNELLIYLRGRVGVDKDAEQLDSLYERGYGFVVLPAGTAGFLDGAIAITEFDACHTAVPHPEWPGTNDDFGVAELAFPIVGGDWYGLEISAQGSDEGGPVLLSMSAWPIDEEPPVVPQLTVVDEDGMNHTPETLDPANNVEVLFGTSFDFGQQQGATARIDDLTITTIGGCAVAPVTVTRDLWGDSFVAEGRSVSFYEEGGTYQVRLELSGVREQGVCDAAGSVTITDIAPVGWEIESASNGGQVVEDNIVQWSVDISGGDGDPPTLTYEVNAVGVGRVEFGSEITEPDSGFQFVVGGERTAVASSAVRGISDFGSIQHWLTLGPFTRQVEGASPGEEEALRDYLTDGETTQENMQPAAGDTIEPDYDGDAASTGLAADLFDRNPDGVPTWVRWIDFDDDDDRIDFESIYGGLDEIMCYATCYLDVFDDVTVNFGVSSDDSVHVLLDGETLYVNSVARGALGRTYQDSPLTHESLAEVELEAGRHTLTVKVFDGGGEHNFRIGFVDEFGVEIDGGPEDIEVSLVPAAPQDLFLRGDTDENGTLDLTDGIRTLNFLFSGGEPPGCFDSADTDDNGAIELTDAVGTFSFLFLGAAAPPAPGHVTCGEDPTVDTLECSGSAFCI